MLLLSKEPSKQTLTDLSKEENLISLAEISQGAKLIVESLKAMYNESPDVFVESIRNEYQRLFVGPGPIQVPIWESVYFDREKLMFGERTLKVRNFYKKYDIEFVNKNKEPEDHLGVELEFIIFLINKSLIAKSHTEMIHLVMEQSKFLDEHLHSWNEMFSDLLFNVTDNLFFQGLALLLKEFIVLDIETLNQIREDLEYYERN